MNGEHEYNEGFVKYAAQSLLGYAKQEQQPAEWSEKDEKMFTDISWAIRYCGYDDKKKERLNDYLKTLYLRLRPQPYWRPSEEQMNSLKYFIKLWGETDAQLEYTKVFNNVESLYDDLKKL